MDERNSPERGDMDKGGISMAHAEATATSPIALPLRGLT